MRRTTLVAVAAISVFAPRLARAEARPDEITFEAASASVKHVSVHFNDGAPLDLSIYGPAPLSSGVIAAIKAQKNNVLYGALDGVDIRSKDGTSLSLFVFPAGAADDPKLAQDFDDYFIGSLGGYADFAPGPDSTMDPINNVFTEEGAPVTKALAKLGEYVGRMEKQGRTPSFQFGILLSKGSIRWRRFALSPLGDRLDPPPVAAPAPVVPAAHAASDMVFQKAQTPAKIAADRGNIRLFGPVRVSDDVKQAKGNVYLYVDAVDFAGKAASAELLLVDPTKKKHGALVIDRSDTLGSLSNVAPGGQAPTSMVMEVHDFDSQGVPHRALTHLKGMRDAMIAVVDNEGVAGIDQLVVTTRPPDAR